MSTEADALAVEEHAVGGAHAAERAARVLAARVQRAVVRPLGALVHICAHIDDLVYPLSCTCTIEADMNCSSEQFCEQNMV